MQMMVWQQTSNSQPNNSLKQPEPTSGRGNQDPKVQAEVKSLLKAKERVEELQAQLGIYDNEADQPEAKEPPPVPIWQLPVQPLFFEGDVNQAKSLAKIVADSLQDWTGQ
ncbi:hypothetical protein WJX84_005852 [Apatococcus fuscideae]|uniref:Uncharacterized protein n=1 Tax=Apatococcus fuscideae TaxID=2026836 RepID=A0AAW1SJF3_9CHLO